MPSAWPPRSPGWAGSCSAFENYSIVYSNFDALSSVNLVGEATIGGIGHVPGTLGRLGFRDGRAVHPGEVVGLIGPNGAGKTTLIDVITGYVRAQHFDAHPPAG